MTRPAVEVRALSKWYRVPRTWSETLRRTPPRWVAPVKDVSFAVRERELFGLLGANGAGKTTLFRMLATLVVPDAGSASVLGHDVAAEPARVRALLAPVLADERSLHWRLSARENLRLFAALYGLAGRERDRRVAEALDAVSLAPEAGRTVGTFSSGMRQRVLVARALVARPRVLLLDEPTRSLDPISARELRQLVRERLVGEMGCTVILATHSTEEALALCDRVGVLDRGQLLATGTVDALGVRADEERWTLWTRHPVAAGLAAIAERAGARDLVAGERDAEGWCAVSLRMAGGHAAAARLVRLLAEAEVEVARLERQPLTLADVIEGVVARARASQASGDDAPSLPPAPTFALRP